MKSRLGAISILLLLVMTSLPAKAEVIDNIWQEFAFPVFNDSGCAGENGWVSGLVHITLTDMERGLLGIHVSEKGTWKGETSGDEYLWKSNIVDIVPIAEFGELFNVSFSRSLNIIGRGPDLGQFRLKSRVKIIEIGGELVVLNDNISTVCKD